VSRCKSTDIGWIRCIMLASHRCRRFRHFVTQTGRQFPYRPQKSPPHPQFAPDQRVLLPSSIAPGCRQQMHQINALGGDYGL
jgi:hypothetical protein